MAFCLSLIYVTDLLKSGSIVVGSARGQSISMATNRSATTELGTTSGSAVIVSIDTGSFSQWQNLLVRSSKPMAIPIASFLLSTVVSEWVMFISCFAGRNKMAIFSKHLVKSMVVFFIAAGFLSACNQKKTERKKTEAVLNYAIPRVHSLNWSQERWAFGVTENLVEPLLKYEVEGDKIHLRPGLVEKWKSQRKGRRWVLQFRQGLKWSDGQPFSAKQMEESFAHFLSPETATRAAENFLTILGAREYFLGNNKDFSQVGVRAEGTRQLIIDLESPNYEFPHYLTNYRLAPVRKEIVDQFPKKWFLPPHFVSMGPYILANYEPGKKLEFRANPHYYAGEAKIKKINGLIVEDANTAVRLFDRGQIDLVLLLPYSRIRELSRRKTFRQFSGGIVEFLHFNVKAEGAFPKEIRQEIDRVLDRKKIAQALGQDQLEKDAWLWPFLVPSIGNPAQEPSKKTMEGALPS